MTRIPVPTPAAPKTGSPALNAHAAKPNDSEVSSVTKIKWKAFNDILVNGGAGRKIVHRPHGQPHQAGEKKHGEGKHGIDHFLFGQQVHEIAGDEKRVHHGD